MKIEQLHLAAFGPFTNRVLDFSSSGLQLVFGCNEAGKSSALRAIDSLLFGIPAKTSDNFIHPYDQLRIGATLSNKAGDRVEFARRKKRKPFVSLDEAENVLSDNLLDSYLKGIEQKSFRDIYCIDHPELRMGGELMRELKGLAGESLLVASTSAELPRIEAQLQDEIVSLFVARGRKNKIKLGIAEYQAAKKEKLEHEVRVTKWTQLQTALDEQERLKSELRESARLIRADYSRLERLRDALPKIAEWKRVNEELSGEEVTILPESYSIQQRQQCETELRAIDSRLDELREEIKLNKSKLDQIAESPRLLAEAESIEALQQRIGAQVKSHEDRRQACAEVETAEREVHRLLREIAADVTVEQVDELRLRKEHRVALSELAETERSVRERPVLLASQREEQERSITKLRKELGQLGEPLNTTQLERVIREVTQLGDITSELDRLCKDRASLRQKVEADLASLPDWDGTLQDLVSAKLPLRETIDQHAQATVRLAEKMEAANSNLQIAKRDHERLLQDIEAAQKASGLVTEADLLKVRKDRDSLWLRIRQSVVGDIANLGETNQELVDQFQKGLTNSDNVADRLRREADRVAELVQRESQASVLARQIEELSAVLADLSGQERELQLSWTQAWHAGGMTRPASAEEMAAWLERRAEITSSAVELRSLDGQIEEVQKAAEEARGKLHTQLNELSPNSVSRDAKLSELHANAEDFVAGERTKLAQREQLNKDLERLESAIAVGQRDESKAVEALERWEQDWSTAMSWIACPPKTTSALARARVSCLEELTDRHESWGKQKRRIETIDIEERSFADEVAALAQRAEIDVADWAPVETARRLKAWLDEAKEIDQAAKSLGAAIAAAEEKVNQLRTKKKQNASQIAQFVSLAGVNSDVNLSHVETQSDLALGRRKLREEIQRIGGGNDFDGFVAAAEGTDIDELEARLVQLEEEIQEKVEKTDQIVARITEIASEMDRIDGNAASAEADQRAMNCLANVHELSRRYATLKIAQSMLRRHIERYQEENRDPLLAKASEYFATMTGNEFLGLQVDYDDNNRPIIHGIRRNRKLVDVTAMSDGTRDPMFLALRLAYIQKRIGRYEPMPFIVDDILIHLDDDRATATLQVLAGLAKQTQVLFFTHHDRLRELAQRSLSAEQLSIHELEKTDWEPVATLSHPK